VSLDVYLYDQGEPFTETCTCERCGHEHEAANQNRTCLYQANITHNLGKMAQEAGIYTALWRPEEMTDPDATAALRGLEYELAAMSSKDDYWPLRERVDAARKALPRAHARDLIEPLRAGLALLKSDRKRFEAFDATNGWGRYEHFVPFVEEYLRACEENGDAEVEVSR
jgi:hypothetical protein